MSNGLLRIQPDLVIKCRSNVVRQTGGLLFCMGLLIIRKYIDIGG